MLGLMTDTLSSLTWWFKARARAGRAWLMSKSLATCTGTKGGFGAMPRPGSQKRSGVVPADDAGDARVVAVKLASLRVDARGMPRVRCANIVRVADPAGLVSRPST